MGAGNGATLGMKIPVKHSCRRETLTPSYSVEVRQCLRGGSVVERGSGMKVVFAETGNVRDVRDDQRTR